MSRPYGGHHLTDEQRELAEENFPLVIFYIQDQLLKKKKIYPHEIDDCMGHIMWGLCMAAETYDKDKGAFSTYAYNAFRHGFCRYLQLRDRFNSRFILTDFMVRHDDSDDGSSYDPEDLPAPRNERHLEWDDIKELFNYVELDPIEFYVIKMYYRSNYSYKQIGRRLSLSGEGVRQIAVSAISKIKKAVRENDLSIADFYD